ncbi:Short-chain dehydrogenase/reductase family 16C member 6-like protein [Leptotrombidium deliense]|uniref:Short-chain dehydrogenase/reductase 3 n=1 Tax=Leptotrombidium deliense TaxID=299467 RepID=A0A443S7Q9_9ACAR|nr:Short-chain dehydrogenase/reductase family 16C member 6-like protein [Leptotrombidium deliense]
MQTVIAILCDILNMYYYWFKSIILFFIPFPRSKKDVSKDIVLITGGGSGFGRNLATKFAALGSHVVIWDINEKGLKETKKSITESGGICHSYVCDVTDRRYVCSIAEKVRDEVGNVTILVNNAGIVSGKNILQLSEEEIVRTFQVNTLSHFWTIKAFLPSMIECNNGHIVSVSSVAGLSGAASLSDYAASKFAAIGLQESLMLETLFQGLDNIHYTTVCPYYMNTGMFTGVQSSILPIMEPEVVADEVITAVLTNQKFVFIPKSMSLLYPLKALMPYESFPYYVRLLKAENTMQHFVGRKALKGE